MSKRAVRVLVALSIFAVAGITLTQIYWIHKAYTLRQELAAPAAITLAPDQHYAATQQLDGWLLASLLILLFISVFSYVLYRLLQQSQLMSRQRDFINNMTHEFQTPISTIKLAADMLSLPRTREQPDRVVKYAKMVQEETQRLQKQVETVLTLARTEQKTLALQPEMLDVHGLIGSIAERHDTYLSLDLRAEVALIRADRLHLTNVLYNLLDNALKYTPVNPKIRFTTRNLDGHLLILIEDNGIGIAPEHKANIFNEFYRVPAANQCSVKGFGLGLSYVRKIVKAHRWKLDLDSTLGKGSTFSIRIPQPTSHVPASQPAHQREVAFNEP